MLNNTGHRPKVAEFFAGIGLMRAGLEQAGFDVVWANDIAENKAEMYRLNFGGDHFQLADVRSIRGADLPSVDVVTASFPCQDLSLAGDRAGLAGSESGLYHEFARAIEEMGTRRPKVVLLENVIGLATSHGGKDLAAVIARLNVLGYVCDLLTVDARLFVAQSRPRLFVVGVRGCGDLGGTWHHGSVRPEWVRLFVARHPELAMSPLPLPEIESASATLGTVVERFTHSHPAWWPEPRAAAFIKSLSELQRARLRRMESAPDLSWRTAYRRTRGGVPVWEIRDDQIAGCLRTARGGSSKQAVVEAGNGEVRVRWMTAREYARLQGAPDYSLNNVADLQAISGFGDAVCVPAVNWIAKHHLSHSLAFAVEAAEGTSLNGRQAS